MVNSLNRPHILESALSGSVDMIWTCHGPEGRIRSRFRGLFPLSSPLSPPSSADTMLASFSLSLSRARTLQNCANPRKPIPKPTGMGYHSTLVLLHALPNRELNDSLLLSFSWSRRYREDLNVRCRRQWRLKSGVGEESQCAHGHGWRGASGQPEVIRR